MHFIASATVTVGVLLTAMISLGCERRRENVSGAVIQRVNVPQDSAGLTAEQLNVKRRVQLEKPGSIKHLYVISASSGQAILYSTVQGKVTTAGKRLMPSDAYKESTGSQFYDLGDGWRSNTAPNEDGTYGDATGAPYIYWFDVRGNYHQHYIEGGQIVHLSDQPINVGSITINIELREDR